MVFKEKPDVWNTVIGVVATTQGPFQRDMIGVPQIYSAYTQDPEETQGMNLVTRARGAGDPAAPTNVVRQVVHELDTDNPVLLPQTLEAVVANAWFYKGLMAQIFGMFGGVVLVLAGVGLYGMRMALGAEPRDVLAMILREGGARLGVGLSPGLVEAHIAGRLLAFTLYGVEPGAPVAFAGTLAVLGSTGLVACLVPALRAVRVNPVETVR